MGRKETREEREARQRAQWKANLEAKEAQLKAQEPQLKAQQETKELKEAQQRAKWKANLEAKEAQLKAQEEAKEQKEQSQQQMFPYIFPDQLYPKLVAYLEKAEEHLKQAIAGKEKHSDLEWAQAYAGLVAAHASLAISAELHTIIPASRLAGMASLLK